MNNSATSLAVAERHGSVWTATLPSGLRTQAPSIRELVERLDDLGAMPEAWTARVPSETVVLATRTIARPPPIRGGFVGEALAFTGFEVTKILQQLRFQVLARSSLHVVLARMRGMLPVAVPMDGYLAEPVLDAVVAQSGADHEFFRAQR